MIYHGRHIDVLSLWGEYIDIPASVDHPLPSYLPKMVCPNPKHDTFKHHFQVNTRKPLVHCFARCGISGSYEHALQTITGCDEKEAKRLILKHSRTATSGDLKSLGTSGVRKTVTHEDAVARDERALDGGSFTYLPREARNWLDSKGITAPSRGKWQLGWDEEAERIVIPAFDDRRTFRFLIRRRIDGIERQKYLYTDGAIKTSVLFGVCYAERESLESHGIVLCEGPLDVVRLHQVGIRNAAAILGTGISARQVKLIDKLSPKRVYLFFDRDSAGIDNILDCHAKLRKLPLLVCRYRSGKSDPGETTKEEAEQAIERALPISMFIRKARNAGLTRSVS